MSGKFRPPLLKRIEEPAQSSDHDDFGHIAKKRRIEFDQEQNVKPTGPQLVFKTPGISSLPRKPLLAVNNSAGAAQAITPLDESTERYYNVLW